MALEWFRGKSRQIVSVDGEGNDIDGVHAYTMLCAADDRGFKRHIMHDGSRREMDDERMPNYGLPTKQALDFLLDCRQFHSTLVVSYSFSYDVTKILADLPLDVLREISDDSGNDGVKWEGYLIKYRPRKWFEIIDLRAGKRQYGNRMEWCRQVRVWDVFTFFQSSFVEALWGAKELFDPAVIRRIAAMKERRSEFENLPVEDVLAYCYEECQYLSILCRDLLTHMENVGLYPSSFDGPGSVAIAWFKKERITDAISFAGLPESVALAGYYGGRFEISHTGYIGDAYAYDINSAYPHITRNLPCLIHGKFRKTDRFEPGKVGIYRVGARTYGKHWGPFPFRVSKELSREQREENRRNDVPIKTSSKTKKNNDRNIFNLSAGTVCYPHGGERWVWQDEVSVAIKHYGADSIDIREGWVFDQNCNHKPFEKLTQLYEERAKLKAAGNGAQKVLKLLINSVYGKTAQSVGYKGKRPATQSYIWAGMITSGCRAMVLDMALQKGADVVSFATDGIISRTKIPGVENSKELGGWEVDELRNVYLFQSGIYSYESFDTVLDENRNPTGEKKWTRHMKTRGYALRDLPAERMIDAWNDGAWYVKTDPYNPKTKEGPRQFIPIKLGLMRKDPRTMIGQWVETKKSIAFDPSKRIAHYERGEWTDERSSYERTGNILNSSPYELPDDLVSDPYVPKQVHYADDSERHSGGDTDHFEADSEAELIPIPFPLPKRVLVTGSRDWGKNSQEQRETLTAAVTAAYEPGAVLVHGACPTGADALAERVWQQLGGTVERHPADWDLGGRSAGPQRNRRMVAAGANVCLAFIRNNSRGASGCAQFAENAGIPTQRFTA